MLRCYDCGSFVPADEVSCLTCGGGDITDGPVSPLPTRPREIQAWPWPWTGLDVRPGYALVLAGGKGLGKSSIAALLRPDLWLTNEMEPGDVGALFARVNPEAGRRLVACVSTLEDVRAALVHLPDGGTLCIDSLAEFGLEGGVPVLREARTWAQTHGGRVVAVNQVTKEGTGVGREALEHLADIVAHVRGDEAGRRRLDITKNRGGSLFSASFVFDEQGRVTRPVLRHAYTVEGPPGGYKLTPIPTPGAAWADVYKHLPEGVYGEGTASCGRRSNVYRSGWLIPEDAQERQRFAEAHGLRWIDPLTITPEE